MKYCVGFVFDDNRDPRQVALIHKLHGPSSVVGRLNGVGGKYEQEDTEVAFRYGMRLPHPMQVAQSREFREEAGLFIPPHLWELFAQQWIDGHSVYFYQHFLQDRSWMQAIQTKTDEAVGWYELEKILWPTRTLQRFAAGDIETRTEYQLAPNVAWLIQAALNRSDQRRLISF